ncbi:MAG: Stp1/IreP family PP2C-type Ser/Thr phosphatase [Acidimicrobiales bacterium]
MTTLQWGGVTDTGKVRTANQDSFYAQETLFAVADGMGGHAAGEVASSVAIGVFDGAQINNSDDLVALVQTANQAVLDRAETNSELTGMGTTLCAIALVHNEADPDETDRIAIANVGDSRVYLFHNNDLTQITIDHSLVEDLVREGRLTPTEARQHPKRNILTRVLGIETDLDVDVWDALCYRGDRFLLCSDGLFNEVDDDRIASVLRRLELPDEAARELLRLANEGGGRDNITVVVVDIIDDGGASEAASASLANATSTLQSHPSKSHSSAPEIGAARQKKPKKPARPKLLTWRSGLFLILLVGLFASALGAIQWFANNTYYVGVNRGEVTIFRGRPDGILWIDPVIEEGTGMKLDEVPVARREAINTGKQEPSLEAAREYIANLEDQIASQTPSTTTTTTTTSTTLPIGTATTSQTPT